MSEVGAAGAAAAAAVSTGSGTTIRTITGTHATALSAAAGVDRPPLVGAAEGIRGLAVGGWEVWLEVAATVAAAVAAPLPDPE